MYQILLRILVIFTHIRFHGRFLDGVDVGYNRLILS